MADSIQPSTESAPLAASPQQLQLAFAAAVEQATYQPATANITSLWKLAEQLLATLAQQSDYQGQLVHSGDAIAQIVDIFAQRAEILLQQLEQLPTTNDEVFEPVLLDDLLQGLIRQTMALNLETLTYPAPSFERQSGVLEEDESLMGDVEKNALLQWLEMYGGKGNPSDPLQVAHEENISGWATQVRHYVATCAQPSIHLRELAHTLQWGIVQLWMTLLLGNLDCQWQQGIEGGIKDEEAFYYWDWTVTITAFDPGNP